jgi:hypothetical protein
MSKEINDILNDNKHKDLNRFLNQRKCLNITNQWLLYSFHLIQSSGLLVTSYAASVNDHKLIWLGISLNGIASLFHIYEKLNSNILKKLLNDIILIKDGKYIDESNITPNLNQNNKQDTNEINLTEQSYQNNENPTEILISK